MAIRRTGLALWGVALWGLCCAACSEAGLQPIDHKVASLVDDRLDIEGRVCTSPPNEQVFPVKIMFIVDSSGSMQFTDPSDATASGCATLCPLPAPDGYGLSAAQCATLCAGAQNPGRQAAVQKVIDRFRNNPAVSFSVIRFNGRITVNGSSTATGSGFTNDASVLSQAAAGLGQADITTDYQGALSTAYQVLEKDLVETDPVQRARTKYVLIFLSDGAPDPVCAKGCGNDTVNVGVVIDSWCDVPREEWCDNFSANAELCAKMREWYPAMTDACQSYNSGEDLMRKVNEIVALGQQYNAGELRLHTAFLFIDSLPQAVLDIFAIDKAKSEALLKSMATAGGGFFRSFNAGQAIDFLDINYSSVARPFGMTSFIASSDNALPATDRLLVDTDGDGVDDTREFQAKSKDRERDSDSDGYNDKLELDRLKSGFDPTNAALPVRACAASERIDRDGDGLLDCEEAILGTDPKLVDSDRDRIPDGIEFAFGTDPAVADAKDDSDFDGKRNDEEIKTHSSPMQADPEIQANFRYIYDREEEAERVDRRSCLDFTVRRLRLVSTAQRGAAGTIGFNEATLTFGEGPADDPRDFGSYKGACVRAQYVRQNCTGDDGKEQECGFKNPATGKITLTVDDFYDLAELSKRRAAAQSDRKLDPCVGVKLP
ncbi:MAG: VWA domain-containing protein [Proteobacteria bacterium]|nr:VWA domain-containing protein [Pseudomonadota bacterium]